MTHEKIASFLAMTAKKIMTKIFITIPWFLPAFRAGGPIQSIANLVKEFNEDVEYFIFCGDTDLNGAALENIEVNQWVRFNDHTQVWYAGPEKISDTLVKQVDALKPDILFIIGLFSWHYNMVPMAFCKGPVKILSTRGMLHPGALSQKKWKKKAYLKLFKLLEYHYKVSFHATDEEEANYIKQYFGTPANVFVAGNFPKKVGLLPTHDKERNSLKLLTIALISPMKNILLVLQALEKVVGNIQYDIYGPIKDDEYWDKCEEQAGKLPEHIKVVYHREIEPEKIKEALSETHVFILPSKSENFGHAIYEALSAGRPVITSNHTPWNTLQDAEAGMNVAVDDLEELINAINFFVIMDGSVMEKWSRGAFDYAAREVDVDKTREEYRGILTTMPSKSLQ
jgi:glycosyltransferase involved in cell wall biosynthesis